MNDFRVHIVARSATPHDVDRLLRQGQLLKAIRKAREIGLTIAQDVIDDAARSMSRAGRSGELLAMIGRTDIQLPYTTRELLVRTYEVGDHHTFLKQAHRLDAAAGLEDQIQQALQHVARRAPDEAQAWRRKLGIVG